MAISKQFKNRKEENKADAADDQVMVRDSDKSRYEANKQILEALEQHHEEKEKIHEKLVDLYLSVKVRPAD